jgi:ribonuclease VapC
MIIDTSAIVAIMLAEPEREPFARVIATANQNLISAANYLEVVIVLTTRNPDLLTIFDAFLEVSNIEVVPCTYDQARVARQAYLQYGKGRHPARLNFGDCFAYALAQIRNEPLLFKGNDFSQTDVRVWGTLR